MGEDGYNGWKNYETWSVALIIDNDERTQARAQEITADAVANGEPSEYWSEDERRRYRTADALKDWITTSAEVDLGATQTDAIPLSYLWSQLVSAALSEVDWYEIAENYLSE